LEENFKIKPLTKAKIIISLDRLTRFKPTEEKYFRVFEDIILSNLIFPKYKKKQLNLMEYEKLTKIAEEIFNYSLNSLGISLSDNFDINKKLLEYEKSVFIFDKNIEKLLDNKINYLGAIKLLENESNLPLNLLWLKSLNQNDNQIKNRANFGLKFPVEKIILAEGITEEILFPKFALICGYDFDKMGINLISAGGKNQVVKLFYKFADILKLPIFVLLDKDAQENFEEIKPKLRKGDEVHVLSSGEFEDTLSLNLIKRTLNRHYKNYLDVKFDDLRQDKAMTEILEELLKNYGLEFKKAEFATLVKENVINTKDISDELKKIITKLG
jgi:hypothetical protein